MENKEYYCDTCKYGSEYKTEFNKHLNSAKHKRGGKYIEHNCEICDYKALNKSNLTVHQVTKHYTVEQKKTLKYYCELCDSISFSKLYCRFIISS